MIIKDHDQPLKLWKLEALVERLVQELQVFSEVEEAVKIARAGDRGERSIDYYVDLIDSNDLKVFYDLRLPYRQYHFQVDTLLMTSLFILLIEIKNIAGFISFNKESKQMIRTLEDTIESYPDPLLQVLQQKFN